MRKLLIFRWLRRMKKWVESYADRPNAGRALLLFALIEAVFFPIPPDLLLIALAFSIPKRAFRYAVYATVGSLAGAVVGYVIGYYFSDLGMEMINWFDPSGAISQKIDDLFNKYGFWGIVTAALTPIPFKVFTIASGLFKYNLLWFLLASAIGRAGRFFSVSALFYFLGPKIKPFIDKYFEILSLLFVLLLLGGFVLIKYVIK